MPGTCAAAVLFECASCPYQGSLSAWSILSCTSTDLRKWLLEIWLLASTKKAPAAAELSRELGKTQVAISAEQTPGGGLGRAHLHVVADASAASLSAASSATTSSDASSNRCVLYADAAPYSLLTAT